MQLRWPCNKLHLTAAPPPGYTNTPDGVAALCVIVLSVFIPAQASPLKQRIGTLLWVGMMVALFSIIIRIFKIKNGGYPFSLL